MVMAVKRLLVAMRMVGVGARARTRAQQQSPRLGEQEAVVLRLLLEGAPRPRRRRRSLLLGALEAVVLSPQAVLRLHKPRQKVAVAAVAVVAGAKSSSLRRRSELPCSYVSPAPLRVLFSYCYIKVST